MRQSYEQQWLKRSSDGALIGLSLGSDRCAEHEWGIGIIRRYFKMDDSGYGLDRRRVLAAPPQLVWLEGQMERPYEPGKRPKVKTAHAAGLYLDRYQLEDPQARVFNNNRLSRGTLWTGWSEGDLGAFSIDPEEQKLLRELFDAFQKGDGALWLGGGGVFQNAGLCLAIASRLDPEVTHEWNKADREREQLEKDVEATGIRGRLQKAKCGYYALSPRREKDGSLVFWLNPMDQDKNHYGWFTVADLDEWIAGKGKIPMTPEEVKDRKRRMGY